MAWSYGMVLYLEKPMQIIVDKINAPPVHALTRADVKALLAVVPEEWLRHVQTVHLSANLRDGSRFDRPVIYNAYSRRLNVCSRYLAPDQARREILRELAVLGLKIKPSYGHKLSQQQLKEIDEVIAPYLMHAHQEEQDVVVGEGGGEEHGVNAV